jgi:hypothetical protein
MCSTTLQGFHFYVKFHPVELAVMGVWIDAHDRSIEPALAPPEFGIEKHFDPITDADGFCHTQ